MRRHRQMNDSECYRFLSEDYKPMFNKPTGIIDRLIAKGLVIQDGENIEIKSNEKYQS